MQNYQHFCAFNWKIKYTPAIQMITINCSEYSVSFALIVFIVSLSVSALFVEKIILCHLFCMDNKRTIDDIKKFMEWKVRSLQLE